MMTVLVTGVAGRVGSALAQRLVDDGYDVRGTVRPGGRSVPAPLASRIDVVEADLSDRLALARAVQGVDVVVHLAAQMVIGASAVDDFFDVNVMGTLRLLEAAVGQPRPVRRFVFGSTDNTYGPAAPHASLITEAHPQLPGDYYGTSKVLAEQLVRNYGELYRLEHAILRFGSVLAPDETPPLFRLDWVRAFLGGQAAAGRRSNVWQLFVDCADPVAVVDAAVGAADGNQPVRLAGPDGTPWSIHLTDVRDVVDGIVLALEHPAAANQALNMVGPRTTTFDEAADVIAARDGTEPVAVRMPMTFAFELSTAKARRLVGYLPAWDFAGMLDTAPRAQAMGAGSTSTGS